MTNCLFSDRHEGARKLFKSLKHYKYLKSFDLKGITLTDSIEHIAATIVVNKVMDQFCLTDCNIADRKIENFFAIFKNNKRLQHYSIRDMIVSNKMCIADALNPSAPLRYLNLHY